MKEITLIGFQYLIGRIKRTTAAGHTRFYSVFQYLIGRIKRKLKGLMNLIFLQSFNIL